MQKKREDNFGLYFAFLSLLQPEAILITFIGYTHYQISNKVPTSWHLFHIFYISHIYFPFVLFLSSISLSHPVDLNTVSGQFPETTIS